MRVALYVLAAWALVYLPKYAVWIPLALSGKYDNREPRAQQATFEGWRRRATAAHMNGWESFPAFAAAAILAQLAHVEPAWIDRLGGGYLAARALYPVVYIADLATVRSLVWGAGVACTAGLLILALRG